MQGVCSLYVNTTISMMTVHRRADKDRPTRHAEEQQLGPELQLHDETERAHLRSRQEVRHTGDDPEVRLLAHR